MIELRSAIRGTGSVRAFTDNPVSDELLYQLLDDARFAPSGGNRQSWRVAVVKDVTRRLALGDLMQGVHDEYVANGANGRTPFNVVQLADEVSGPYPFVHSDLLDNILQVPVMLVVAADLSLVAMMDKDLDRCTVSGGASIYPFCWNLLLSARAHGLGGVMTTFLARAERDAAAILELPEHHAIAAVLFIGHPVHQPTKLRRKPVEDFTTVDTFAGPSFHG